MHNRFVFTINPIRTDFRSNTLCLLLALICVLEVVACRSRSTYIDTGMPPSNVNKRSHSQVKIFTVTKPTRPFREAGIVEARQSSALTNENDVIKELRQAAADRGCDGVIITGSADEVVGGTTVRTGGISPKTTTVNSSTTTLKGYRGTCIVYTRSKSDDAAQRAKRDAGISRVWSSKGHWVLSMMLKSGDLTMKVSGTPSAPESVVLTLMLKQSLSSSTSRNPPQYEACELELLSEGNTTVAIDRSYSTSGALEEIEATLPTEAFERATQADDATLKLCDTEIALSEATRKRLQTFAQQLRSEKETASESEPASKRLEL